MPQAVVQPDRLHPHSDRNADQPGEAVPEQEQDREDSQSAVLLSQATLLRLKSQQSDQHPPRRWIPPEPAILCRDGKQGKEQSFLLSPLLSVFQMLNKMTIMFRFHFRLRLCPRSCLSAKSSVL